MKKMGYKKIVDLDLESVEGVKPMKTTDSISRDLESFLNDKKVLEVACGDSEFSFNRNE